MYLKLGKLKIGKKREKIPRVFVTSLQVVRDGIKRERETGDIEEVYWGLTGVRTVLIDLIDTLEKLGIFEELKEE